MSHKFKNKISAAVWISDATSLLLEALANQEDELHLRAGGASMGHALILAIGNLTDGLPHKAEAEAEIMDGLVDAVERYRESFTIEILEPDIEEVPDGVTIQ